MLVILPSDSEIDGRYEASVLRDFAAENSRVQKVNPDIKIHADGLIHLQNG